MLNTNQVLNKILFLNLLLIILGNCCQKSKIRSIIRGNYQNVLSYSNGPFLETIQTNFLDGGQKNGILFRDQIYLVTTSTGFTYCYIDNSIIISLRQVYELNTFTIWLWDRGNRRYSLIVYISYNDQEQVIYDSTVASGILKLTFPNQYISSFRIYNRNGNEITERTNLIKAEAYFKL
ncbi:unnamed protein product (macronuclear) [Paramecium tetraurelia]|uniref:TNF family profile domain-containing protein n=1 Tax=Paramecium tetraurelia TaxID=5888 RepID=A0CL63_PARTE|nr:uncharacterized protein GSPATT00008077001 [Paramecium tetraurelia]CAK71530.1 unnamed protein product [Paramecium tetraurelia]|eukprot:XP_001438927.1 hypothetical protein (macronuclear) [Paramecium tetraurelia strain d4-2]